MNKFAFLLVLILLSISNCSVSKNDPVVILISFDGFRYDYADSSATPNLDTFARYGVRAQGLRPIFPSKTFPNHYSIATGMYADKHGIVANQFWDAQKEAWYRLADRSTVEDGAWYGGEPIWNTLNKNGRKTASYFWVGSEAPIQGTHPTYFYNYDHNRPPEKIIEQTEKWLKMPDEDRPSLITLYFHDTDDQGHAYGPNSSELRLAVQKMDSILGQIVTMTETLNLNFPVNFIVVSDHGMTEIDPEKQIAVGNWIDLSKNRWVGLGPFMQIWLADSTQADSLYNIVSSQAMHFDVFRKNDIPERWHYRHPHRVGDLLLVANEHWSLVPQIRKTDGKYTRATHGYDNILPSMQGIFYAKGPAFAIGKKTGILRNIDVYPLIASILRVTPNPNIDGHLDSIKLVLR
jgi:ectonucleotide pyrophosphatase/phosphodiesterase family protein 5